MPPDALKALQSQMAALQTQLQAMAATIRQLEASAATEPADPDYQRVEAYKTWICIIGDSKSAVCVLQ